jgi:FKBP-type peptidyl-prolyl cis-trans isomerase 2
MIGETLRVPPPAGFGEKKPELFQARVESTMEAVEETIGAKAFSRAGSLTPSYAAVQYFSVKNWSFASR